MARLLAGLLLILPVGAAATPHGPELEDPVVIEPSPVARRAAVRSRRARTRKRNRRAKVAEPRAKAAGRRGSGPRKAREKRPPRVFVTVAPGDTLSEIAATHGVSLGRLARENGIENRALVRAGQRLRIPRARGKRRPPCRSPAVSFLRLASDESAEVVLTRCNGVADREGRRALSKLARSLGTNRVKPLHPRLLQMLQRVAKRWPRRRLLVISGFRPHARPGHRSNHTRGRAIDFRVEGVSNVSLRSFCRRFDRAGVGFYPNSVFVHLDVRREGLAFWVDYSRPGEPPRYGRWPPSAAERARMSRGAANAVRDAIGVAARSAP